MVDFAFDLANPDSLDVQKSMGIQALSAQIKGLWSGSRCMRPEEQELGIFVWPYY